MGPSSQSLIMVAVVALPLISAMNLCSPLNSLYLPRLFLFLSFWLTSLCIMGSSYPEGWGGEGGGSGDRGGEYR